MNTVYVLIAFSDDTRSGFAEFPVDANVLRAMAQACQHVRDLQARLLAGLQLRSVHFAAPLRITTASDVPPEHEHLGEAALEGWQLLEASILPPERKFQLFTADLVSLVVHDDNTLYVEMGDKDTDRYIEASHCATQDTLLALAERLGCRDEIASLLDHPMNRA